MLKCKYIYFTRSSSTNEFYTMNGAVPELVNSFNDIGINVNWTSEIILHQLSAKLHVSWDLLNGVG